MGILVYCEPFLEASGPESPPISCECVFGKKDFSTLQASRFVASVQLRPLSSMRAEDLRRFFLESAENVPVARLQEMIEAMDSTLGGVGSSEDDFATFLHQASDASKGIR